MYLLLFLQLHSIFMLYYRAKKIAESIHKADEKFIKTIYNEGIDIYIDDEPVSNNFNVKGTNLLDYSFKVKDKKIYFISKK